VLGILVRMRSLIVLLCLVPIACGGGVSSDPSANQPGTGGIGGGVGVGGVGGDSGSGGSGGSGGALSAKSLLCSEASIQHEDDVAIWYSSGTTVTFLRHDGTETVVHEASTDQKYMTAEVGAAGNRIGLLVQQTDMPSHLYLFDRQANLLASQTFPQNIHSMRMTETGIAFTITVNQEYQGRVWDGVNPPRNLGGWVPLAGPDAQGWVPVQEYFEQKELGFISPDGAFQSFPAKDYAGIVKGRLMAIDKDTRTLFIGTPSETKQISLAEFSAGDVDAPFISNSREEGWISIQRQVLDTEVTSVLVVNVETGEVREIPTDGGSGSALAFYCNQGFPGYLASDGTLIHSYIANGKLEMRHDNEPFGMPLSGIAALFVAERNGTVVQVASDGSDTYCGDNSGWPFAEDTLYGNSMQIYRGGETMVGEFVASYQGPMLDVSGSCAMLNQYGDEAFPLQVKDLETKTTRDIVLADTAQWAQWIE
jgi:hypothetical protein